MEPQEIDVTLVPIPIGEIAHGTIDDLFVPDPSGVSDLDSLNGPRNSQTD